MPQASDLRQLLQRKRTLDAQVAAAPQLAARLGELRAWQASRLAQSYADLQRDPEYAPAVEFFLNDLYGPQDFSARDGELVRALGTLVRSLPEVAALALLRALELEVLTAELDRALLGQLSGGAITAATYARAYRAADNAAERQRQIDLTVGIGELLSRAVRLPFLGVALRAARAPARVSGFGALQSFLERGYAAFRRMRNPAHLLRTIRERETCLRQQLLSGSIGPGTAACEAEA